MNIIRPIIIALAAIVTLSTGSRARSGPPVSKKSLPGKLNAAYADVYIPVPKCQCLFYLIRNIATVPMFSQIELVRGSPVALVPVTTLATDVPTTLMSITVTFPADLPSGTYYGLVIGQYPDVCILSSFTIQGVAPQLQGPWTVPATPAPGGVVVPMVGVV
ncbi:hypothetical protein HDV00_003430 [Rhizophlyctis rosea]|nr:hypothetical protein HDV00_003430 [Rhizophlyctis rosea]